MSAVLFFLWDCGKKNVQANRRQAGEKRCGRLKPQDHGVGVQFLVAHLRHFRNRQSLEGNRRARPELPQAGRSEPEKAGGEGRPASGLYQPSGAGDNGRKMAKTGDLRCKTLVSRALRVCFYFFAVFSGIGLRESSVRSARVIEDESQNAIQAPPGAACSALNAWRRRCL